VPKGAVLLRFESGRSHEADQMAVHLLGRDGYPTAR